MSKVVPQPLSMKETKDLVKDLFTPNPWIYWTDFTFFNALGWWAFVQTFQAPAFSIRQGLFYVVASFSLYRAVIFIHELTHLKKDSFQLFRVVWNLACGIPFLVPTFLYMGVHIDHHKQKVYGTHEDGEYFPFVAQGPASIVRFILLLPLSPLLFIVRFGLFAPLGWLVPPFRRWVWTHASSMVIDAAYRRPAPEMDEARRALLQEILCVVWMALALGWAHREGVLLKTALLWYAVAAFILFVNGLRTLAAHGYRNPGELPLAFTDQFQDSVNVPGNFFLTPLWAPVGLRYHAVHHLFPSLPYHSLGKAHRRLMEGLPEAEKLFYRETLRPGLWAALAAIWRESDRYQANKASTVRG